MGTASSKPTYQLLESKVLGKGTFGIVYEGRSRSQERVAIKKCDVRTETQADIVREINNLQHIEPHKHICKFLDFQYDSNAFLLVMEFCDKGDLELYMKKYAPNLEAQIKIMHQCTSAVQYMHSVKVVHRDIKPANILFKTEGRAVIAKLCDFGLAKIIDDFDKEGAEMKSIVGTKAYMAPELYARKGYDHTVDNFALALVFLAMINYNPASQSLFPMTATHLQSGNEDLKAVGLEMCESLSSRSKLPTVVHLSPIDSTGMKGVKKVIIAMSDPDPKKRMALPSVLAELEKLASVNANEYRTGSRKKSHLFNSNLDITKTKAGFDGGSLASIAESGGSGHSGGDSGIRSMEASKKASTGSQGSQGSTKGSPRKEQTASGKGSSKGVVGSTKSMLATEEKKKSEEKEDPEGEPEIGYVLMRQMIEDHVRRKREQELREKEARLDATKLAEALPLLILLKLMESDSENAKNFAKGDKVKVDTDYEKAKQLQVNHGGWQDRMKPYLGKIGTVEDVNDGKVKVKFTDGQSLTLNAHLLQKVDERTAATAAVWEKSKFKRYDLVKVKVNVDTLKRTQQSCPSGWREGMRHVVDLRGVVHTIDKNFLVLVEFLNGDKWWLHPGVLEIDDLSGVEIEAGDMVIIIDDKARVKELQKGHGEWLEEMNQCLGKAGVVKRVAANNKTVVEVGKQNYIWNIKCCKLLAKAEEVLKVMIEKCVMGK